jgi:hypothetical protein
LADFLDPECRPVAPSKPGVFSADSAQNAETRVNWETWKRGNTRRGLTRISG